MDALEKQARRDLNPQPPDLESGALAVRATGPYRDHNTTPRLICSDRGRALPDLPGFAVNRMLSTKAAILLALEPIGGSTFVLHCGVITLTTGVTC
jgi:hypothetical protein